MAPANASQTIPLARLCARSDMYMKNYPAKPFDCAARGSHRGSPRRLRSWLPEAFIDRRAGAPIELACERTTRSKSPLEMFVPWFCLCRNSGVLRSADPNSIREAGEPFTASISGVRVLTCGASLLAWLPMWRSRRLTATDERTTTTRSPANAGAPDNAYGHEHADTSCQPHDRAELTAHDTDRP